MNDIYWGHYEKYKKELENIIRKVVAFKLITIDIDRATEEQDMKQVTDLVVNVRLDNKVDLAIRVREWKDWYSESYKDEVSIRARIPTGGKTEIDKIKDGWGRYYLYCWGDGENILNFIYFDIEKARNEGVFEEGYSVKLNGDGTSGMYIPIKRLEEADCIIARSKGK